MISVRRLNAVGAGLALVLAGACTAVWGDATGNKAKPSALASAIHTPQETGALTGADIPGGRFSGKPVVTYETLNGELHFALQLKPRLPDAPPRSRDIAVVVDTSASQVGNPLKNARLVAEELVKSARPNDRIAVWTVNTPDFTRDLSGGLQPASGEQVKQALASLKREYAAGATDLKDGLKKVLRSFPVAADRQQVVLYLGDGESPLNPLNDGDRSALAADMVSRAVTFFAVPLGVRLDPKNLHGLTSASGGAVVRKHTGDQPAEFVRRLDAALAVPVFYPSATKSAQYTANVGEVLPARLPPLRGDAPTLLVGLTKPATTLGLKVDGTVAGKPVTVDVSEPVPAADAANYFLVNMLHQWRNADRTAPALVRADRGLALAYEQTRLVRDEYLTQAQWALSQNKLDAAQKLFSAAQSINPRDTEATTGLKVVAGLKDGRITREQLRKELSDPKAMAMKIEKGLDDTQVVKIALDKLAEQPPTEAAPPTLDPPTILQLERSRQRVQEQQITQVVDDTIKRARQMLNSDPDAAYELLKRQLTSVRENTELSDSVRATLASRLESALRSSVAEGARVKQQQEAELQRRIAAEARRSMEAAQQSDEERIRERVRAFSALMNQARFEEAYKEALVLQQEQMAKGRAVPVQANAAYFMATNAASLREFEELRRIKEDRYMLTMLQVEKSHVPFPDEPPVAFPPAVTWRELSNYRRDKYDAVGLEGPNTRNALRIRDKLNQSVNVEKEIDNTPLKDVLGFLSDKYDVTFIVDVQAFDRDNANKTVEDSPVRLPKMPGVSLGTILRFVLGQVQGTYLIRRDYIEITTNNASIAEKAVRAYPVADLVIPIPNSVNQQALNQNLQVLGSSLSANGMAIFGAAGGGGALGFAGPLGALGTLGALGALGGVGGGAALGVGGGAVGLGGGGGGQFQGQLGFAGGNNQTNQGFGGGTLGFGGGQQGQFGNLGGQFGIQGGNTSGILIELIKDVIAPKEWNDRAARYLFNNVNTANPDDEQPILNPDLLNSMGYYQPSNALVVRGTSRLHTRIGGGNIGSAGGGGVRMGAAAKGDKGDALVIAPKQNRDKNNGGVTVAKAPAAPKPGAAAAVTVVAADPKKDRDPKQAWEEAVEKGLFRPRQVIAVADLLAHFEKFDEVVELLKADLRHGVLAQPCCFDALALALKQSGGTIEEIERIRLSQIDLEPSNPQSYLRAAAAMNELGRPEQAVAFCKRAAGIEPNGTDSYAQSLVYLDKAKAVDTDAVQWAATNLSTRDWAVNDPTSQADAKKALADLVAKLTAAGRREDAARIAALASPSRHDLAIEVTWGNEADVDLAVTEPIGSVCSNQNRQTVGGGRWRGDRLMSRDQDRFSETYTVTEAFSGTYEIKLTRVWGKPLGDKATVKATTHDGTPQKREEWHRVEFGSDGIATLKVQLDGGRRTASASVPPPAPRAPAVVVRDPDRVFNLLRAMAEPAYAGMSKQRMASGGTSAAGTLNTQVMNSATDLGPEVYHQNTLGSGTGADLVGQAVVSSDGRSVRVSAAPVFQTATARPEVNLSLIPGGR